MVNHEAIYALYPNVVSIGGDIAYDKDRIEVQYNAEAVANWVDPKAYAKSRAKEYPSIGDQLDMIWHAIDSGTPLDKTSALYTTIAAVKDKYPK